MRKTFVAAVAVIALVVLVLPIASQAGGGPKDHKSLFLRLATGGVYASTGDDTADISGIGGDFTFLLGGCVSENLALHGSLFSWSLWNPDVEFGSLEGELDGSLSMNAYGGGLTYYFMPINMYLTGNFGLGRLSFDAEDIDDESSDWGFAMDASFGKEWWVGNSWGLGLAAVFGFHSIEDASGYDVGVRFSATFN